MGQKETKTARASLETLISGAERIFDNAERLFLEAEVLAKNGGVARPVFLHQISLEECSKISTIGAWALSILVGLEVDQEKILRAFGRHQAKNNQNAYMLEQGDAEKEAIARGDWEAALEAFKLTQREFHKESNDAKNGALYVDWLDGEFVSPNQRITDEILAEIRDRNARFLGYASNEIKAFRQLEQTSDLMRTLLVDFVDEAEKLREEKPDDLAAALNALLSRFFEDGKLKSDAKSKSFPKSEA